MSDDALPDPPLAERRPFMVLSPQGAREDEYYWLRDDRRQDPAVLAYLTAENDYHRAVFAPLAALQERLYAEITARIRQDDASVPYRKGGYWYYTRYETGHEYPIHARRHGSMRSPEQVLLDVNELARGHEFFQVDGHAVSPDGRLLAWAEDAVGRRQYQVRFRDLDSGTTLPDVLANTEADICWAADNRTLLYVGKDPQTLLGSRVYRHRLGSDAHGDPLVWEQHDTSFYTRVEKTRDERFLLIGSESTVASEWWYADAADPLLAFRLFLPRERDHEYQIERAGERWIVRSNWQAVNFRIVEVEAGRERERGLWRDLVPHDPHGFVHGFDVFRDFLAVEERCGGLRRVRVQPWAGARPPAIASDEPTGTQTLGQNAEFDSDTLRYEYTSLTTPRSVWELHVPSGERRLLKRDAVLGDYSPQDYRSELLWIDARDGTRVPVSLAWREGTALDGTAPLLQYAYGAYGLSQDPAFSIPLLSLLDRGFVYALAHVRGGQELGRAWYDAGRLLRKPNTFSDFIDVTRALVARGMVDAGQVYARGGSAGGLLMGVIANLAPWDYRGIVSLVPFVDIVTTMLDESIPLTTNEYDEWGNPNQAGSYACMLGYSPYDNLSRQDYPAIYIATGLWDSQVQYFEPAKYVARLRARNTGREPVVLRTYMEAGHGGRSGRLQRYREIAEQWAFVLARSGRTS